jgi:hypothetical protein
MAERSTIFYASFTSKLNRAVPLAAYLGKRCEAALQAARAEACRAANLSCVFEQYRVLYEG